MKVTPKMVSGLVVKTSMVVGCRLSVVGKRLNEKTICEKFMMNYYF
jgi:hypothetical protein